MSVLARFSITVSIERDVSAVYRFYKLQASTSSVPAKPTSISTLPPSGWSKTEPSYTEGSTNSLYIVDLTVFTDGSFSYSDVSLSSSYEAAKAAYNKATAAASAASAAQTSANSKNSVFYQASAPSTSGRKTYDVWFDTDDGNKMYYWNGSAWTARQFDTAAIANSAITANLLAANAVTADKILAGAVVAGKLATDSVQTNNIQANAITGAKIKAGEIDTAHLKAGAVTADKIDVTDLFAQEILATGSITGLTIAGTKGEIGGWSIQEKCLYAKTEYGGSEITTVFQNTDINYNFSVTKTGDNAFIVEQWYTAEDKVLFHLTDIKAGYRIVISSTYSAGDATLETDEDNVTINGITYAKATFDMYYNEAYDRYYDAYLEEIFTLSNYTYGTAPAYYNSNTGWYYVPGHGYQDYDNGTWTDLEVIIEEAPVLAGLPEGATVSQSGSYSSTFIIDAAVSKADLAVTLTLPSATAGHTYQFTVNIYDSSSNLIAIGNIEKYADSKEYSDIIAGLPETAILAIKRKEPDNSYSMLWYVDKAGDMNAHTIYEGGTLLSDKYAMRDAVFDSSLIETGSNASKSFAINDYLVRDNKLYYAKTAIASGAAFSSNNIALTNIVGELSKLNSKTIRETRSISISAGNNYGYLSHKSGYILVSVTATLWNTYTKYVAGICDTGSNWAVFFNQVASSAMSVPCHCVWHKA